MIQCQLEKVIFIPTSQSPHKVHKELAPARDRYQMIQKAITGHPGLEVSDIEIQRQGISYTIDTVRELTKRGLKDTPFYLIVGMDMLEDIPNWRNADELIKSCLFLCAGRPGYTGQQIDRRILPRLTMIKMPAIDISSCEIRWRIQQDLPISFWVPDTVQKYIFEKGLYSS
jgi:nicotinate-nucleotide adenylyltransferase